MRQEYEFDQMEARKNLYAGRLEKQVTICLGEDVIAYFKMMAEQAGVPHQNLNNPYLRDCAVNQRKLTVSWG